MYTYIHAYIHTYIRIYIHTYTHTYRCGEAHRRWSLLLLNRSLLPIGAVKLIDFGLAVFGDGENLIKANSVAGTPVYLAPEVLRVTNLN